jgi:flavorubredoxin
MDTRVDEIADGIFRITTWLPGVPTPGATASATGWTPAGLTVNQFLVLADEPLLYHTGLRSTFPAVITALGRILPVRELRWISFSHVEADECGALNLLLAVAPHAEVAFNELGCRVSLDDLADRPPRRLTPGRAMDLGGRALVPIATPHAPHNGEAQVLFEQTTATLLCGDLFTQVGRTAPLTTTDLVEPALDAEAALRTAPPGPSVPDALRTLAGQIKQHTLDHPRSGELVHECRTARTRQDWRTRQAEPAATGRKNEWR